MKIETPLLRRLGPVPFWRGEKKCLDELESMYRRAMERARNVCYNTGEPQTNGNGKKEK